MAEHASRQLTSIPARRGSANVLSFASVGSLLHLLLIGVFMTIILCFQEELLDQGQTRKKNHTVRMNFRKPYVLNESCSNPDNENLFIVQFTSLA